MTHCIESISLTIDGRSIAAIRQHNRSISNQPRMLCVHGWLDNANSFVPLMPHLPAFDLVSIDLPGHGHSDHLPGGYSLHEMIYQISLIVRELEWDKFHLTGHSLGACIAPMIAVAIPDCIKSLVLIEASGPMSEEACDFPQRIKRALEDRLDRARYDSRTFTSKEEAIATRLRAARMTKASARLIIDRQLRETASGFVWRFDPRWRMASSQYQTEEQVMAVLSAVQCPVLTVLAEDGYLLKRSSTRARLDCLNHRQSVTLAGHHHLHMDTPEPIAAAINRFLDAKPDLGDY